jgi:hypothetical protein
MGSGGYLYHAVHETPPEVGASSHAPRSAKVDPPPVLTPPPPPPPITMPAPLRSSPIMVTHRDHVPVPPPETPPDPPPDTGSGSGSDGQKANPKADALMDQANKAYDNGDFDEASAAAVKVLATDPGNIRMMRIMVSSGCQSGDIPTAQKYFLQLPLNDRSQMRIRCGRYGIVLQEPT